LPASRLGLLLALFVIVVVFPAMLGENLRNTRPDPQICADFRRMVD
jgi:hypothetical protein